MAGLGLAGDCCLFLLLDLIMCDAQPQNVVLYGGMNQNVTFKLGEPVASKDILWKKGKNKVIEWEEKLYLEPRSFPPFINRVHLDTQTGDLTIFNVTSSDEDEYEVEYGGAKGSTKFTLKVVDAALRVDIEVPKATVPEKAAFQLGCSIASHSGQDSRFAVTWISRKTKVSGEKGSPGLAGQGKQGEDPTERMSLLRVGPDGVFGPEGGPWEGRLRFQRPSLLLFRLTVLQASPQDTGNYSCRVEEWVSSPQGDWYLLAEEESAPISIRVLHTGSTLQSRVCSNDALFYFFFFCPLSIFSILIIRILLMCFKSQNFQGLRGGGAAG